MFPKPGRSHHEEELAEEDLDEAEKQDEEEEDAPVHLAEEPAEEDLEEAEEEDEEEGVSLLSRVMRNASLLSRFSKVRA